MKNPTGRGSGLLKRRGCEGPEAMDLYVSWIVAALRDFHILVCLRAGMPAFGFEMKLSPRSSRNAGISTTTRGCKVLTWKSSTRSCGSC